MISSNRLVIASLLLITGINNILFGEMVVVYHSIERGGNIESVKKHGLLTRNELFKRGLSQDKENPAALSGVLPDQYDIIYFSPKLNKPEDDNIVGFMVNTETTYVYNREYRCDGNQKKYLNSKILLATYLANKKKAEEMWEIAPQGKAVIFNPMNAQPFYVEATDKRYYDPCHKCLFEFSIGNYPSFSDIFPCDDWRHYSYLGEVIINRNCIPPKELIFFP